MAYKLFSSGLLIVLAIISTLISVDAAILNEDCHARLVGANLSDVVCVCNTEKCADIEFNWPTKLHQVLLIQSTKSGKRFHVSEFGDELTNGNQETGASARDLVIKADLRDRHQVIMGWGGAFTDATGYNIKNLSEPMAEKLLESYFGDKGLQYNFGRVPIGGSDFSTRPYTYDDTDEPDYKLKHWSLTAEDTDLKIPIIKKAVEIASKGGRQVKLFASPWTAPAWMKTNNDLVQGFLIDDDLIYRSYADYLIKFYQAYEKHGIKFWGATVQNEPISAWLRTYFFNSMQFNNDQMAKFISNYLGPALEAKNFTKSNFKLMVGDDTLGLINFHVPQLMQNPEVRKYVSGLAFHWYLSDFATPFEALNVLNKQLEGQIEFVMMSEACEGWKALEQKVVFGSWTRAENYAIDIIQDLLHKTGSWIDWNMALNMHGGPNWSKNFVDSPILVDATRNEFYKQPMYYSLSHFSRLFRPGSIVIKSKAIHQEPRPQNIYTVAVHDNSTNHVVVNVLNLSEEKRRVSLTIDGLKTAPLEIKTFVIEPKSLNSVVVKL